MADPAFDIVYASTGHTPLRAGDTMTFTYPAGRALASYKGQWPAYMNVRASQAQYVQDTDFTIVYGLSTATVTYNGVSPIAADTSVALQLLLNDLSGAPTLQGYAIPDAVFPPGL